MNTKIRKRRGGKGHIYLSAADKHGKDKVTRWLPPYSHRLVPNWVARHTFFLRIDGSDERENMKNVLDDCWVGQKVRSDFSMRCHGK